MINRKQYTYSRSSPKSNGRACLCKDSETYSRKCCDGELWSQGIGNITGSPIILVDYFLLLENNDFLLLENSDKIIL